MRQFNIEEAKAGLPVCTRNGRPVVIYDFCKLDLQSCDNPKPIVAKISFEDYNDIQESVYEFHRNGRLLANEEGPLDLVMKTEEIELSVNLYRYLPDNSIYAEGYSSEEDAPKFVHEDTQNLKYIKTAKITIEV